MPVQTLEVIQHTNDAGQLVREEYRLNGELHNENGPAIRSWNAAGQLIYEEFCLNNRNHNENGPAARAWEDSGELIFEEFWLNGKQVDSLNSCDIWDVYFWHGASNQQKMDMMELFPDNPAITADNTIRVNCDANVLVDRLSTAGYQVWFVPDNRNVFITLHKNFSQR